MIHLIQQQQVVPTPREAVDLTLATVLRETAKYRHDLTHVLDRVRRGITTKEEAHKVVLKAKVYGNAVLAGVEKNLGAADAVELAHEAGRVLTQADETERNLVWNQFDKPR